MATNIALIIENLCRFYDFTGKTVVSAGAGGGQFVGFGRRAGKIIAIDNSAEALEQLRTRVDAERLSDLFELVHSDFYDVIKQGDVVLFEFCLHEMPDPFRALQHARTLAPDIVVIDHAPGSEWTYYTLDQDKVKKSAQAMKDFGFRRQEFYQGEQLFKNHGELVAKVSSEGPEAIRRTAVFEGQTDIVIPMLYAATLL